MSVRSCHLNNWILSEFCIWYIWKWKTENLLLIVDSNATILFILWEWENFVIYIVEEFSLIKLSQRTHYIICSFKYTISMHMFFINKIVSKIKNQKKKLKLFYLYIETWNTPRKCRTLSILWIYTSQNSYNIFMTQCHKIA